MRQPESGRSFQRSPIVEFLETRIALSASELSVVPFPSVDYFGGVHDWGINAINAPEVWQQGFTGDGVIVAVIDSGVDILHVDLVDAIWSNPAEVNNGIDDDGNGYIDDLHGWDFANDDNTLTGTGSHGTYVSGIIAAQRNDLGMTGVAYDAKIMPLQAISEHGGSSGSITSAIIYAVNQGADIINLSIGGDSGTRRMEAAIKYASDNGVLIVAAAGNDGAALPLYPAMYSGQFDNVLSVGAFDDSFEIARSSNRADNKVVQVAAPGVEIYSTESLGGHEFTSGTSMAAAHVTGLAALAHSANPNLSAKELRELIVNGADAKTQGSPLNAVNAATTVAFAIAANEAKAAVALPVGKPLHADFDVNGTVGFSDFLVLSSVYGKKSESADLNGNGVVEFTDLLLFAESFGQRWDA